MPRKDSGYKAEKSEAQMNVPISRTHHEQLAAIALVEKKSMKRVVEGYIEADGRGARLVAAMKEAGRTESAPVVPEQAVATSFQSVGAPTNFDQ